MTAVLVSNIPAPYREPVFEIVANHEPGFLVLYCQPLEPDRKWSFPLGNYPRVFLKGMSFSYNRIYSHHVHWNPGVWRELGRLSPDVVITNGYNPSHLIAILWALIHRRPFLAMTDGWLKSEEHLSFAHRFIRKLVLKRARAFIGASNRSLELFQHYGAPMSACYLSYLCGNNEAFFRQSPQERPYDIMFSGQFIERKMPSFFCEVARLLKERRGTLRVLLIGDGPLRERTLNTLRDSGIDFDYPGFLSQDDLPARYASAKVFVFPTQQECWGVVVNEACAAGTPVVTCDNTAVDGELVCEGVNGRVLPLDVQVWADAVDQLLNDSILWNRFSMTSRELVRTYTYRHAAQGLVDAIQFASRDSKELA